MKQATLTDRIEKAEIRAVYNRRSGFARAALPHVCRPRAWLPWFSTLLLVCVAPSLILLLTASVAFGRPWSHQGGSTPRCCARYNAQGSSRYYWSANHPVSLYMVPSQRYYAVPRPSAGSYSGSIQRSRGGADHKFRDVPGFPSNPYANSPNYGSSFAPGAYSPPASSSSPSTYGSSSSSTIADASSAARSFSYKCAISRAGDYCLINSTSPVSSGTRCLCGGRYNGYVE
jgi:hypothetical protein